MGPHDHMAHATFLLRSHDPIFFLKARGREAAKKTLIGFLKLQWAFRPRVLDSFSLLFFSSFPTLLLFFFALYILKYILNYIKSYKDTHHRLSYLHHRLSYLHHRLSYLFLEISPPFILPVFGNSTTVSLT